jgi:hypothetical protein
VCRFLFSLFRFSFSERCRRGKPRHTAPNRTTLNVLCQHVLHFLLISPTPDRALGGTAAPVKDPLQVVLTPNTLYRDRIVIPLGWDKMVILPDGFDAKRGASANYHPMPELTRTAMTARENCTVRNPRAGPGSQGAYYLQTFFPRQLMRKHVADPTPNPQQPDARTRFPREELTTQQATRRSRPVTPFAIPPSHPQRCANFVKTLGFSPSHFRRPSVCQRRWRAEVRAPRLATGDARARCLSSGAR